LEEAVGEMKWRTEGGKSEYSIIEWEEEGGGRREEEGGGIHS
jgi:hypothetical protein